jgi:hypothetical protein
MSLKILIDRLSKLDELDSRIAKVGSVFAELNNSRDNLKKEVKKLMDYEYKNLFDEDTSKVVIPSESEILQAISETPKQNSAPSLEVVSDSKSEPAPARWKSKS